MKQFMPTYDDGKEEHLYLMPPRNKLLLQKNSTSPIHATRYATTDMDYVLGVHVDSQNPNIHDSLADSFMNQPVVFFAKKKRSNPYIVDCFWQRVCCKYCHPL